MGHKKRERREDEAEERMACIPFSFFFHSFAARCLSLILDPRHSLPLIICPTSADQEEAVPVSQTLSPFRSLTNIRMGMQMIREALVHANDSPVTGNKIRAGEGEDDGTDCGGGNQSEFHSGLELLYHW